MRALKIGFVGLDPTGQLIVTHIMGKKGHAIMGYDPHEENRDIFHDNGGIPVDDPNIIYENCDLIMLRQSEASQVAMCISDVLETGRSSLTIIDLSPFQSKRTTEYKDRLKKHDITVLTAPIPDPPQGESCSPEPIGVYGEKSDFEKHKDFMSHALTNVTYLGLLEESD